ncbi:MAG: ABC transporter ATP-binding protein [Promethearchaeota archaeon]
MPKIELLNVTKTFNEGKVLATDNVTLTIDDGDFILLLGPSGCGKTTLLKLIAGLHEPTAGKILVDGIELGKIPPEERNIGFVFQHFEIFPAMTVYENVAYGLTVRGYSDLDIEAIVTEALKLVNLYGKALSMPGELSTPEQQKVGLARAIATRSKILFLDEPLGKLDPGLRNKFRHELRRLIKKLGLTAIQVTHDQEEAMSIADKIIVMRQGKILQEGTPQDLYYKPKTIFVANFFGETNFLEGFLSNVKENSCTFHIHLGGPRFNINLPTGHGLQAHVQSIIAYRIEDVELIKKEDVVDDVVGVTDAADTDDVHEYSDPKVPRFNRTTGFIKDKMFIGPLRRFIVELMNGDEIQVRQASKYVHHFEIGEEVIVGFHENPLVFEYPKNLQEELSKA